MKVTKHNFLEILPGFVEKLASAVFVAFDLEFTGIYGEKNLKSDSIEQRFKKMVQVASKYSIIQVGVSIFSPSSEDASVLETSSYAFYVFPEWGSDVVMSPSSISFLKKNNMDFNLWITDGLPFVNEMTAKNAREAKEKKQQAAVAGGDASVATSLMPNRPEEVVKVNAFKASIDDFVKDDSKTELVLPPMNAFLRKCLHSYLELVHPSLRTRKDDEKPNELIVCKVTEEQKAELEKEEADRFALKLGFRLIWEALIQSGKPIVGHNSFFDLLFLFRWIDAPLPTEFSEFQQRFHTLFGAAGGLFDTKFIADCGILANGSPAAAVGGGAAAEGPDDTSLGPLFDATVVKTNFPGVKFAPGFAYDDANQKQAHDAGYDAYMTGAIFAANCASVGGIENLSLRCKNKLYLMQSLISFSLEPGESSFLRVTRGDIYHLSGFPSDTKTEHIIEAFDPSGTEEANKTILEVSWIDGTTTYLIVKKGATVALPVEKEGWVLHTFAAFEAAKTAAAAAPVAAASGESEPDKKKLKTTCSTL